MPRRSAWAKVNLSLHITGCRADGYHELESLVVFAGVGDDLVFAPAAELTLSLAGPFAPAIAADDDNLVLRAARALRTRLGLADGARIRLDKRLPVAAGIGGGSADAAAALTGLAELWGAGDAAALAEIAPSLGADVPVCLAGGPSYVSGIGERIAPVTDLPPAWLVLVNPGRPLATGAVFAARKGAFSPPSAWVGPIPTIAALAGQLGAYRNDLEPAARRLLPEIGDVLAALSATEGCLLTRMSGSGATCFGLYGEEPAARAAAAAIQAKRPMWWAAAAPVRGRSEL
jgi:4-diphosphocytidyl-2-C-methyl-D-erythritol kinase